jgi:hypothetical protein
MDHSKIRLSAEEMQLVSNSHWILTKRGIIEKVYRLFGTIAAAMQLSTQGLQNVMPQQVLQLPPKISKGEQYEALPYVVLDYPRFFEKENVFAIRCFFWWGNYFSITLHLKGKFREQFGEKIIQAINNKKLEGFYLSVSGNEFNFNLADKNYFLAADEIISLLLLQQVPFLKISHKISFSDWDTAQERLLTDFQNFINIIFS